MHDDSYSAFFALTENAEDDEKAVILELLKGNTNSSSKFHLANVARISVAYVFALFIFILESIRLAITRKNVPEPGSTQLFASSSERNSSNDHLARLQSSTKSSLNVLILESPLRQFKRRIEEIPKTKTFWCRTLGTDFDAMFRYMSRHKALLRSSMKLHGHNELRIKPLAMCFVRLLRGHSISNFLEIHPTRRLVFTLSGNACTSIIEQRLKGTIRTVHWLHGVGLGIKFDSFSDLTLVNNEYDHQFYADKICGGSVFFPRKTARFSVPNSEEDIEAVAVYSNLIHPSNQYFDKAGTKIEGDILSIVSSKFDDRQLVIKPHPITASLLGDRLDEYLNFISGFGFELQDNLDGLAPDKTLFISTISTSFIDLIARGHCVFLYNKFGDSHSGFQDHVCSELKFVDAATLDKTLNLFHNKENLIQALKSFAVQSQTDTFEFLSDAHLKQRNSQDL